MNQTPGPGVAWLAARTGGSPADLTSSPAAAAVALSDAFREIVTLAARSESTDPAVRAQAQAELVTLQEQFAAAPPAAEVFLGRVAAALRNAADRLRHDEE